MTKKRNANLNENKKLNDNNSNVKEKLSFKYILKDYFKFYKTDLRKKQIILFILSIAIFGIFMGAHISNLKNEDYIAQIQNIGQNTESFNLFETIFKEKILVTFVLILAGITPYLYISVLGISVGYQLAYEMVEVLFVAGNNGNVILMCIGAIIQTIGFSLASATGIVWCKISTKRRKYANSKDKSFLDFKKEFYLLKGDDKKIKELEQKRKEKAQKDEKNNVNVPYLRLLISFVISSIIVLIGTIVFYI